MLDGQTHLVKQGWKGAGHPLKAGGRARPIVIAQKKTLGGIGKDRDESFAFWDHVYDVAAKSIKFKIPAEDEEPSSEQEGTPAPTFHRTRTGIISNRRPTTLPTPSSSSPSPPPPFGSIISRAKQEAARRSLYSRFLRGPVITQETLDSESIVSKEAVESAVLPTRATPPPTSTVSPSTGTLASGATQPPVDEQARKLEKAARKQARAERREAKVLRRAARAEKKVRKAEGAARKAAKLKKRAEKESRKRLKAESTMEGAVAEQESPPIAERVSPSMDGERRKKDRRRKPKC
ncbi:hypothetical protein FRC08_002106 [Ceratobasidium sp. 394]|nr:hypothetical protein FRC08_002106 [Ceratobasidium sp. 394]